MLVEEELGSNLEIATALIRDPFELDPSTQRKNKRGYHAMPPSLGHHVMKELGPPSENVEEITIICQTSQYIARSFEIVFVSTKHIMNESQWFAENF
jgi:hypothetical protein